jgi:hypothetical protein
MSNPVHHPASSNGRLSYKPTANEGVVPTALSFIREQLPIWRDDKRFQQVSAEKGLNWSLYSYLDHRSRFDCPMIRFSHEAPQTKDRSVDIGVHGTEEITVVGPWTYTFEQPFMVLEAKRLPAPTMDREREYVTGKPSQSATGGIQRFKLGLHGAKVEIAVIVGYVEKESFHDWFDRINSWIGDFARDPISDGCVWTGEEQLAELRVDNDLGRSDAVSSHCRTGASTDTIWLHHLWILMNFQNA